jgi:putative FmdB family regulatory protein
MPLFDFKCRNCGHTSEFFIQNMADINLKCESCGSHDLEKMLSIPSVIKSQGRDATTCCGREERCDTPPCSTNGSGGCCRGREA